MPYTRRTLLRSSGVAATVGLAGCIGGDESSGDGTPTETEASADPSADPSGWRMVGGDPAATASLSVTGPRSDVSTAWDGDLGRFGGDPLAVDGTVYAGGSNYNNDPAGELVAFDAETGERRWTVSIDEGANGTSPAIADETLYIQGGDGTVYAFDTATGDERWTLDSLGSTVSDMTVGDGLLVLPDNGYGLNTIDIEEEATAWSQSFEGFTTEVAIFEGMVYVGAGTKVYALSASDGAKEWQYEAGAELDASPSVAGGTVYVGAGDRVIALDAESGAEEWNVTGSAGGYAATAVDSGTVFAGAKSAVTAFKADDGSEAWTATVSEDSDKSTIPSVAKQTVYLGGLFRNIVAIDRESGEERWSQRVSLGDVRQPALASGAVFATNDRGSLKAFRES